MVSSKITKLENVVDVNSTWPRVKEDVGITYFRLLSKFDFPTKVHYLKSYYTSIDDATCMYCKYFMHGLKHKLKQLFILNSDLLLLQNEHVLPKLICIKIN